MRIGTGSGVTTRMRSTEGCSDEGFAGEDSGAGCMPWEEDLGSKWTEGPPQAERIAMQVTGKEIFKMRFMEGNGKSGQKLDDSRLLFTAAR